MDIKRLDRRVQWWLLIVSLTTLALLVAAALGENNYSQWRVTRDRYAEILREKATDQRGKTIAEQFDVNPDQNVLPELNRIDRCVTCHSGIDDTRMVDQEQPFQTHPGDILASHPPSRYGCTLCHGGQSRATALPDAHGNVPFWPEPMIPVRFAQAGCGTCHTYVNVPTLAHLWSGRNLMERYDCLACHRLDGRGGTIRPGAAGGMEGHDLSHVGVRGFDPHWYEKHLEQLEQVGQSERIGGNPFKTSFGPISPSDRAAIEGFLLSCVGAPELIQAKATFHSLGCMGCHQVRGVGGKDGPDLTHFGKKDAHRLDFSHVAGDHTLANWLAAHLHFPARVVPDSQMPILGLSDKQIERLVLYLLSLRGGNGFPEAYWPKDRIRVEKFGEREFATDGATLYVTFCAGCHGDSGKGRRFPDTSPFPAIANKDFLAVASDQFIGDTIRHGRPGRRMPAWNQDEGGLREEEITKILAYLRQLGGVAEPKFGPAKRRWVKADPEMGKRLFAMHCAGCHGPNGKGNDAPALNNPVLLSTAGDTYFAETIARGRRDTAMPGFRNPSPAYPTLSETDIESIVAFIRTWEEPSK